MVDSVGLADRRAISAAERIRYREVTRPFALCQRVWPCETTEPHAHLLSFLNLVAIVSVDISNLRGGGGGGE